MARMARILIFAGSKSQKLSLCIWCLKWYNPNVGSWIPPFCWFTLLGLIKNHHTVSWWITWWNPREFVAEIPIPIPNPLVKLPGASASIPHFCWLNSSICAMVKLHGMFCGMVIHPMPWEFKQNLHCFSLWKSTGNQHISLTVLVLHRFDIIFRAIHHFQTNPNHLISHIHPYAIIIVIVDNS